MTISGGGATPFDEGGRGSSICLDGLAKRASNCEACWERGVRARFLVGRWERREVDVGIESRPGSDIFVVGVVFATVTDGFSWLKIWERTWREVRAWR